MRVQDEGLERFTNGVQCGICMSVFAGALLFLCSIPFIGMLDSPAAAALPVTDYIRSDLAVAGDRAVPTATPKAKAKAGPTFTGKVLSIGDGDTYWIENNGVPVKVRAAEGDAPEVPHGKKPGQPWGDQAQAYASKRILGKKVDVVFRDWYFYGHGEIVADVIVDGDSLVPEMIDKGLMWQYTAYSKSKALAMRQEKAKSFRLGLWSDPHAQAPWEFRRELKAKAKKKAA